MFGKNKDPIQKVKHSLEVLLLIFLMGAVGYVWIEGYSILDAFYMTTITISTVGFSEIKALSPYGKFFTVALILMGGTVVLYGLSSLTAFIVEGEMKKVFRGVRMKKKIDQLSNHFIICGVGRIGRKIIENLVETDAEFVVLDLNEERISDLEEHLDTELLYIKGDATSDEILEEAGIERAKFLVAVLSTDAQNVFLSLSAKSLNKEIKVIARSVDLSSEKKLHIAGADSIISPYNIAAQRIVRSMMSPGIINFLDVITKVGKEDLKLEMVEIEAGSELAGMLLREAMIPQRVNLIVIGIKNGEETKINPMSMTLLEVGLELVVLGTDEQINELREMAAERKFNV